MKRLWICCTSLTMLAMATHSQGQTSTFSPGAPATSPPSTVQAPPLEGKNSFTESQAKSRLESAGYTKVMDLRLDGMGIWRATAMKDGKKSDLSLDYKGNVTANNP